MAARKVNLRPGQTHRLTLPGLGSAGYAWESSVDGASSVVEISKRMVGETPGAPPGSPPPAAHSRDELFLITGIEPGEVTVRLRQRRPWEKDREPLQEVTLEISVGE